MNADRFVVLLAMAALISACARIERVYYRCDAEASGRWIGWSYAAECQRLSRSWP